MEKKGNLFKRFKRFEGCKKEWLYGATSIHGKWKGKRKDPKRQSVPIPTTDRSINGDEKRAKPVITGQRRRGG